MKDADNPSRTNADRQKLEQIVDEERGKIVTTIRAAGSAKLRQQVRVRSFRSVLIVTTVVMMLLAILVALVGFYRPTLIPLCFAPEEAGEAVVVCPTAQSDPFVPTQAAGNTPVIGTPPVRDIDNVIRDTATAQDLLVVELVGLIAASVAAAAAIRRVKGSSERYSLPVALAVLNGSLLIMAVGRDGAAVRL